MSSAIFARWIYGADVDAASPLRVMPYLASTPVLFVHGEDDPDVPVEDTLNLAAASRESDYLSVGVSPRGSAALLRACQGWAAFDGRPFVIPEDVKQLAPYVWGHRVQLDSQEGLASGYAAIERLLQSAPVPLAR